MYYNILNMYDNNFVTDDITYTNIEKYIDSLSTNITEIDISKYGYKLISLPDLSKFKKLKKLYCYESNLTHIEKLPSTLEELYCYGNIKLKNLPELPPTLIILQCNGNILNCLPPLPNKLQKLDCSHCNILTLPPLPPTLIELNILNNKIKEIPELPHTLIKFNCSYNKLTELPELPNGLKEFGCSANPLKKFILSNLPPTLEILRCSDNNLEYFSELPSTLIDLSCTRNNLKIFPKLPSTLKYLDCSENKLKSLPVLPLSLKKLWCYKNKLIYLPDLPDTIEYFDYSGNKNIVYEKNCIIHINEVNKNKYLSYCLKYQDKFNSWLWKVREKIAMRIMHPSNINRLLNEGVDIDDLYKYLI